MAPNEQEATGPLINNIGSFVVLDLETSNLPTFNGNKAGITEFSMYGLAAELLRNVDVITPPASVPEIPRVLHKMTLMLNPRMMVHPEAEKITGLNNYMLEHEHSFDENAGNAIMSFIQHMTQPVCLVAHNGENFDFPLVKKALEKVNMSLPAGTLYVDTLHAFYDIDQEREAFVQTTTCESETLVTAESSVTVSENAVETSESVTVVQTAESSLTVTENATETLDSVSAAQTAIEINDKVNWRTLNETTPKRPTKLNTKCASPETPIKESTTETPNINNNVANTKGTYKSRRKLFSNSRIINADGVLYRNRNRPYPERGVYKLGAIFERRFGEQFKDAHRAESDVAALTKLILHYGKDFLQYAQEHAVPFEEVRKVGASTNL